MRILIEAIEKAGYKPGDDVALALDCGGERALGRRIPRWRARAGR